MTDKATLLALAERVERLDGPDRELDAEIAHAMGWFTKPVTMRFAESGAEVTENYWTYPGDVRGAWSTVPPHSYTASLDAAMTLVPEGDGFTVGQNVHHGHWAASVNYLDDDGAPQSRGCSNACRTGALALCAAALRAHAETRP